MTKITKLTLQGFKSFRKRVSIPFFPGFVVFCGPNGVGKSAGGDTNVLLANGNFKPIKELVENAFKGSNVIEMDDGFYTLDNPENIRVLGLDPETMQIREKDVASFVKREGEKSLIKIRTRSGKEVVTTKCHPVMFFKDKKIRSVKVGELKEGELIAVPRKIDIQPIKSRIEISEKDFTFQEKEDHYLVFKQSSVCKQVKIPIEIDEKVARFFGYLIGDGYVSGNSCGFVNSDETLIKDFIWVSKKFGIKPRIYEYAYRRGTKTIALNSLLLAKFLRYFFNNKIKSGNKHIPREILFSDKRVLSNFLASLFDCDSYIAKKQPSFEYSTKSELLARQVQFSLLRFGIYSRLVKKKKYASNTKQKRRRTYYSVCIEGIEDLKTLAENIRFRSKEKIKRLRTQIHRPVVSQTNVDIFPKEVNEYIHELALMLGVNVKKTRKKFPRFAAYCENRCYPTRDGIWEALMLFEYQQEEIKKLRNKISSDQENLMRILKKSPIMIKDAARFIGLSPTMVGRWDFRARMSKENILKLRKFLEQEMDEIIEKSKEYMSLLEKLTDSNIIWDKIVEIKEVPGEEWVYDLCIPNCHNFIGNLIFVHNSNILDSLCFVLGRTSAKSLRAGRLYELIHHGNKKIPPSDYASVSLWLDNSENTFPFETPEVSIKRKINRKGISVYKINGKTTTREKVLELLSSARINPNGFNIIMQGDVAQVIEMTPQERRGIIDDISGISHYNEKKDKAQKNLDIVGDKLREVEIILSERMERLQELETDRNVALKYKDLREKLEVFEASLAHKKFETEEDRLKSAEEEIGNSEEGIQKLEEDIKVLEEEIESKEKRREDITEKMFIRSKEAGIRQEIEDVKNKILRNKDRVESNRREIERIDGMIDKLKLLQEGKTGFFSKAVKTILGLKKKNVYGMVGDIIKAPEEYESAVEIAGGFRLQNLVVNNVLTATECIDYLKNEKIGRATFLPLSKIRPKKFGVDKRVLGSPGVIGRVTDLINYDKKYSPVIEHVFGNTIIVENLGIARRLGIGTLRMVTLDGNLVERSGAMVGGYYRKKEWVGSSVEVDEYEQTKKELEEEINFLKIEIGQLNQKNEELRKSEEKESKEVIDLENERIEIDKELEDMRIKRREMFEERMNFQNRMNRLKIKSARLEAEVENLRLEFEKHEKVEYIDEKPEILQNQIQKMVATLNSLGLVNMKAIDEYEEFKGEFDELKGKYDEVRKEKQAIEDMIEKIEEKRKEVFYECLRGIDRNFRTVFKKIAGGDSSLELENPLNIESGLLIQANPAGKNMLNIDAMSGGEKSLTALAFLFGVQKHKPAPFYVLDEIDAFLDKVNTKKIVQMIKELSKKDQFIVITHNDYTIKQGDRVYGVAIETGESKIIGLELPEEAG